MPKSCTPFLMFAGEAREAIDFYMATFKGATIEAIEPYGEGEQMPAGSIKQALITIAGQPIRAFDSPPVHAFTFTPSQSFFVECADETELRSLAAALSDSGVVMMAPDNHGFSSLYCWVADRFGVPWQLNLA